MAKIGYVSLCLFLVLASFAQCGLGTRSLLGLPQIGSYRLQNNADGGMTVQSTVIFVNGNNDTDDGWFQFPKGTSEFGLVGSDTSCIQTEFKLVTQSGVEDRVVPVWCRSQPMPVDCTPDCYWEIDDKGFNVKKLNSKDSLVHVYGWN